MATHGRATFPSRPFFPQPGRRRRGSQRRPTHAAAQTPRALTARSHKSHRVPTRGRAGCLAASKSPFARREAQKRSAPDHSSCGRSQSHRQSTASAHFEDPPQSLQRHAGLSNLGEKKAAATPLASMGPIRSLGRVAFISSPICLHSEKLNLAGHHHIDDKAV